MLAAFGNVDDAAFDHDRCRVEVTGTVGASPAYTAALAAYRMTGGELRLDLCRVEGADAQIVIDGTPLHVDQCDLDGFAYWGIHSLNAETTVTGGSTLVSDSENAIGVELVRTQGDPDLLFHARIDLPLGASTIGILSNGRTGQITGSKIQASTGIDTSAGPGPGVTIIGNVVEADPGQQILPSGSDEVAHNILY